MIVEREARISGGEGGELGTARGWYFACLVGLSRGVFLPVHGELVFRTEGGDRSVSSRDCSWLRVKKES